MNVERVERISDCMRDAGSKQRQRVQPLRFDRLLFAPPAFGDIMQNNRVADVFSGDVDLVVLGFALYYERDAVKINEAIRGIKNFQVAADRAFARKRVPIQTAHALVQTSA